MQSDSERKVLLVRVDRIGDLILSLPVDESLGRMGFHCDWWITHGLEFIPTNARPPRESLQINKNFDFKEFKKFYSILRASKYEIAIVFHAPWWVAFLLFLARVPIRIGQKSQWFSFLFFNHGVRQKRSLAEKSELEYNFALVEEAMAFSSIGRQSLKLSSGQNFDFKKWNIEKKKYFVIHPGMAGSALNWITRNYIDLIDQAIRFEKVVITGTKADEKFLTEIRENFSKHPRVIFLDSQLNGDELICVLQNSLAVVAPSTGVVHIAASTGTRTIGIYSPVRVQMPKRWGPQGSNVKVFVPEVDCPGEFQCLEEACPRFNCMEQVTVDDILKELISSRE